MSGASSNATGSLVFVVYKGSGPNACVPANVFLTNSPNGFANGFQVSDDLTKPLPTWPEGSYELQATYAGDADNLPAASTCGSEPLTVTG